MVPGFVSGIGVIIIISQIFPLFGAATPTGGSLAVLKELDDLPGVIDPVLVGPPYWPRCCSPWASAL